MDVVRLLSDGVVMPHVYLAQWEWFTGDFEPRWRAPGGGAVGVLDLRSIPQMGKFGGTPEGYGVFVYRNTRTIDRSVYLGGNLDALSNKAGIEAVFGSLTATNLRDALWEILTDKSDPTGETAARPLRADSDGVVRLRLGGFSVIKSEPRNDAHTQREIAVFQHDYRQKKIDEGLLPEALRRKGISENSISRIIQDIQQARRRWVGHTMRRIFGQMDDARAGQILPPEYLGDGWEPPRTTIGDTFVEASDTALGSHTATGPNGGFSWTVTDGGFTVIAANDNVEDDSNGIETARAEIDLSGDDHYAQADVTWEDGAVSQQGGTVVRYASGAQTFYEAWGHASDDAAELRKWVMGTITDLDSAAKAIGEETLLVKAQADGSSISGDVDGTALSATDTAITANTRTGLVSFNNKGSTNGHEWDDFEAQDVEAPPPPSPPTTNHPQFGQVPIHIANRPSYGQQQAKRTQ